MTKKQEGWKAGLGKFSKDADDGLQIRPAKGDDPEAPSESYAKVTYEDNTRPAFPRGREG